MTLPWLLQRHDLRWGIWQDVLLQDIFESQNDVFHYVKCVIFQDEVKRIGSVDSGWERHLQSGQHHWEGSPFCNILFILVSFKRAGNIKCCFHTTPWKKHYQMQQTVAGSQSWEIIRFLKVIKGIIGGRLCTLFQGGGKYIFLYLRLPKSRIGTYRCIISCPLTTKLKMQDK